MAKVMMAAAYIAPGTILSKDLVTVHKVPVRYRRADMVTRKELVTVLGNEVIFPVPKGTILSWHMLRGRETSEDRLSKIVTMKGRAITISVSARSAVGRMIRPADHVDVIALIPNRRTKQLTARTLLQNIIVLVTGKRRPMHKGFWRSQPYRTVTLLVLPQEAEALVLAQKLGTLYLTLRNPEDLDVINAPTGATLNTIVPARMKKLLKKRCQTIQRIKVVRGLPGLSR